VNQYVPWSNQRAPDAIREIYAQECTKCGICCVVHCQEPFNIHALNADLPRKLVQIGPVDRYGSNRYLRISEVKDRRFTGGREFKKCAALKGALRHDVRCSVYDNRPPCCSNYAPGSPACIASRAWASMEDPEDINHLGHS
jgi:Fe-S-cluster containining protein